MRGGDLIGWTVSLALHALLILPLMVDDPVAEVRGNLSEAAVAAEVFHEAVTVVHTGPVNLSASAAEEEPAALPLVPPDDPDLQSDPGDAWGARAGPVGAEAESAVREGFQDEARHEDSALVDPGGGEAGIREEPGALPPACSEASISALNLVLDLSDRDEFLAAARGLGLRILVYPPGNPSGWVLEADPADLSSVTRLKDFDPASVSRRAHDLTPDPFFRDIRNRAAASAGLSPTGARIVAAVPTGVDRMFLSAERAYLEALGDEGTGYRTLFGRLLLGERGWRLEILRGR